MTSPTFARAAVLGLAFAAAAASPALADKAVHDYLNEPGQGVVADIGNSNARDVPLFSHEEQQRPFWVYDVDKGRHVLRDDYRDKTRASAGARDVPLFSHDEQQRPFWVYDVDKGEHVLREAYRDRTGAVEFAGPKAASGTDAF